MAPTNLAHCALQVVSQGQALLCGLPPEVIPAHSDLSSALETLNDRDGGSQMVVFTLFPPPYRTGSRRVAFTGPRGVPPPRHTGVVAMATQAAKYPYGPQVRLMGVLGTVPAV